MGADVDDCSSGTREPDVSGEANIVDEGGPEVADAPSDLGSTSKGLFLGRDRGDRGGPRLNGEGDSDRCTLEGAGDLDDGCLLDGGGDLDAPSRQDNCLLDGEGDLDPCS